MHFVIEVPFEVFNSLAIDNFLLLNGIGILASIGRFDCLFLFLGVQGLIEFNIFP